MMIECFEPNFDFLLQFWFLKHRSDPQDAVFPLKLQQKKVQVLREGYKNLRKSPSFSDVTLNNNVQKSFFVAFSEYLTFKKINYWLVNINFIPAPLKTSSNYDEKLLQFAKT